MVGEQPSTTGGPGDTQAALDVRDIAREGVGAACHFDEALATALDAVPVLALAVCLADDRVLWVNGEACPAELPADTVRGRAVLDLFDAADRRTVEQLLTSLRLDPSSPRRFVTKVALPGRLPRRTETIWTRVAGSESCPQALLYLRALADDVTDEPGAAASVRLLDAQSVVTEADGTIRWVSPAVAAALELNGPSSMQLLGRSILEIGSPSLRLEAKALYDEVVAVPGGIATRSVYFGEEVDGGDYVVHVQNRLDDPEVCGLVWWRQRGTGRNEGSTLERRLAVLERTLETIARELQTAGFTTPERRTPFWRRLPGADLLNEREERVVDLLAQGLRVPSIAQRLYVSQSTVRNNLSAIYRKLGVTSQVQLLELLVDDELAPAPTDA